MAFEGTGEFSVIITGLASSEAGRRTSRKLGLVSSGIVGRVTFWEEAAARGAVIVVVDIFVIIAARNELGLINWVVVQVGRRLHDKAWHLLSEGVPFINRQTDCDILCPSVTMTPLPESSRHHSAQGTESD
jgi:hypothetical protein